jgi:hypothetical protein
MPTKTTTLTLDIDSVSTLLGIVRSALEESEEQLGEADKEDELMDAETREWYETRSATLAVLADRLNAAGLRLTS